MTVPVAAAVFVAAAVVIGLAGTRLSRVVDRLADRTGMGEALAGMVLLGAATSLSGLVVSLVAAAQGNASLAVSNSLGGIAVQTMFIVVADAFYRRANLEHAAASLTNIFSSLLLIVLLSVVVIGAASPQVSILGVHPVTLLVFAFYTYGLVLSRKASDSPMWRPIQTSATETDVPQRTPRDERLSRLWAGCAALAVVVAVAGYGIAGAGLTLTTETGLTGTTVGAFLTGVATSLPELVTTVAAVRLGALTLAVAGIVGGNTFDVLFVAGADLAYREGSIYGAIAQADLFVLGWTLLMVGIVAAGLVQRDRKGIGFEGIAVIVIYLAGLVVVPTIG